MFARREVAVQIGWGKAVQPSARNEATSAAMGEVRVPRYILCQSLPGGHILRRRGRWFRRRGK